MVLLPFARRCMNDDDPPRSSSSHTTSAPPRTQYGAARALYQRVIQSYAKGGDRLYAEYATQALADMDILVMGHGAQELPVSPALSALQDNRHP